MEYFWNLPRRTEWRGGEIFPRAMGVFVRSAEGARERVAGKWGLIPWFAKTPQLTYATNNARFEELSAKASYKQPWARGQRCIIPALSFDEPCWETGHNVWWRFRRVDGNPWGLAGLWNSWHDKTTGEVIESYTMLTLNADTHPLMRRMHKPDPKYSATEQDKRSVVPIEHDDVEQWLRGTNEEASKLVSLPPPEGFVHDQLAPVRPARKHNSPSLKG